MNTEIKERIRKIENGEIPKGYKVTEVGAIPEDWGVSRIGKIGRVSTGLTPLRSRIEYFNGDIPWIKTTDLNNRFIYKTEESISQKAIDDTSIKMLPPDSLLIAMYGGFNQIGRTGITKICATTNQAISSFSVNKKEYDASFVLYWLNLMRSYWKRFAGSSRKDPNITKSDVLSFPIIKPLEKEQRKIAEIISIQDKIIELKENLLEKKKCQKEYLIQVLFNPDSQHFKRLPGFNGEWSKVRLGTIIKEVREVSTKNNEYRVLSVTKDGIKMQNEHFNKQIASENNIGYKIIRNGNLVFSCMNLWMGSLDILKAFDIGIVSPAYKVFNIDYKKYDSVFIDAFLKSYKMIWTYGINSEQGASIVRRNLDLSSLLSTYLRIPEYNEQKAIGSILSIAQKEIDFLYKEIFELRRRKKALMQLLLTGKVRVKV